MQLTRRMPAAMALPACASLHALALALAQGLDAQSLIATDTAGDARMASIGCTDKQ